MKLLGIELPFEEFDYLVCEQNKGKELKIVNGKVIAVDHEPTEEEILQRLRNKREVECFSIINRGALWYNTLTEEQLVELQDWYKAWLDVTETRVIPEKLDWIK